LLLLRWLYLVG